MAESPRESSAQQPGAWALGPLQYKPDWPEVQRRWVAFWDFDAMERPLLDLRCPSDGADQVPPLAPPPSFEAKYLDPEHVAAREIDCFERRALVGDGPPATDFLMGGYALGCGPGVVFDDRTVWHPRIMRSIDQEPLPWRPGPDDPWRAAMEKVVRRVLDLAEGRFLVAGVSQVSSNDLLPLIRGTQDFLIDLVEDLPRCRRRRKEMLPLARAEVNHFRSIIQARQAGWATGSPGLWHRDFFWTAQSDMSCMISGEMFRQYVLTELDYKAEHCSTIWYHLDGPGALRHVPILLSRPYIRVIQYVAGEGNPPNGPHYMDMYRQVQAAGRGLDLWTTWEHMEYLIRRLRPQGLLIRCIAPGKDEALEMIDKAARWAGSHARSLA